MNLAVRIGRLSRLACVMAIAFLVMAVGARAAGEWKIAEQTMTGLEAPEASIFGTASETFKLSVAWYGSEIECSTLATEAPTKIFPGGTSEAIWKLSSCQILGPPFVSETCKVIEPIELKVEGELLLHGGKTYELFKAPTGKTSLGAIKFKEGTECPLPLSNELKGTFVGETESGEREKQPRTFNSTIEALFGGDSLSFGAHPATLKGKSTWALAAGYKGLKWAAVGEKSPHEKELEEEELELHEKELEKEKLELEHEGEKWQLLKNGVSVSSLSIQGSSSEDFTLLVPGMGLGVKCTSSEGSASASLSEENKKLSGSATVTYQGCEEETFGEVCETKSTGQPDGTIVASGTFKGGMVSAEEIYLLSLKTNEELTKVVFIGEECPLTEIDGKVSGDLKVTVLTALKNEKTHVTHAEATNLTFGGEEAELDNETSGHVILGSITEATGATFAAHLVK